MSSFIEVQPTLENYWRYIILFGRNVASYKFALGKSLLELAGSRRDLITLDQLAEPFARNICDHLKTADKQGTFQSSRFLATCRKYNAGDLKKEQLLDVTSRLGFENVIDAFHVVRDGEVGTRFFMDERSSKKAIRLTENLYRLREQYQYQNLPTEIEARWRLVETAWELNLPRHVLTVRYDPDNGVLVTNDRRWERRSITSCRSVLNGYQKGKCFYCLGDISLDRARDDRAEVDHFFPHSAKRYVLGDLIDGVWNLVLACRKCNQWGNGKSDRVPELRFLERLHTRNQFFIDTHHPLRETLMQQTGATEPERRAFLQCIYHDCKALLVQNWRPEYEHERAF